MTAELSCEMLDRVVVDVCKGVFHSLPNHAQQRICLIMSILVPQTCGEQEIFPLQIQWLGGGECSFPHSQEFLAGLSVAEMQNLRLFSHSEERSSGKKEAHKLSKKFT